MFALAKFDALESARRGLVEGQGTTIHFTIPTAAPWIPLRILALGKVGPEFVDADLFVLTDDAPSLSPAVWRMPGMKLRSFGPANRSLLADLRSDRAMSWIPTKGMWLTAMSLHTPASEVTFDLSIDGGGPAGLVTRATSSSWSWWLVGVVTVLFVATGAALWRPATVRPA